MTQYNANKKLLATTIFGLAVINVAVFWPSYVELNKRWLNPQEPYNYSYVVIVLWFILIWDRLHQIDWREAIPGFTGVAFCVGAMLLWCLGYLADLQLLAQVALPLVLFGWVVALLGVVIARRLVFPFLYLYLAIPVWGWLGVPLRKMAVGVVGWFLAIFDVPAYIDGYYIHLPYGVVEVAGGCSGQNYLIVGLIIGGFYSLYFLRGIFAFVPALTFFGLAIAANWLRILILVLVAHHTQLTHPLMQEHRGFGWVIFSFVLVLFFLIMRYFEPFLYSSTGRASGRVELPVRKFARNRLLFVIILLGLLTSLNFWAGQKKNSHYPERSLMVKGAKLSVESMLNWRPAFHNYDTSSHWEAAIEGNSVEIIALSYQKQYQGKELIHGGNALSSPGSYKALSTVELGNGKQLGKALVTISGLPHRVYWVYKIGNWVTVSNVRAKLYQAFSLVSGVPQAALIAFVVPCEINCDQDLPAPVLEGQIFQIAQTSVWELIDPSTL